MGTLWLFNIAMENGQFIDDFPIEPSIYRGFSMAMLNNEMVKHVNGICFFVDTSFRNPEPGSVWRPMTSEPGDTWWLSAIPGLLLGSSRHLLW